MPDTKLTRRPAVPNPLVNLAWIHPFLEILDESGVSCEDLLGEADLPALAVDDGSAIVPTDKIYRFVYLAAQASRMPDLGLRAGSRVDIHPLLPTTEHFWRQPDVFRTLKSFIDVCIDTSSNVDMWIESRSDPERTLDFFYRGTFGPQNPAFPMVEQFMVALMVKMTQFAAGPNWRPDLVNLRALSIPEKAMKNIAGDAEVLCGQVKTSLRFPSHHWVNQIDPFPLPDSAIWQRQRKSLERRNLSDDFVGPLRLVLRAYLPDGSPSIGFAAKLAGTTVRTLQRRLADRGTTYSQLLDDLRHDVAIYLLRDRNRQIADVSRELGYRDPAIFTRAFRRWTGMTPSKFRRDISVS